MTYTFADAQHTFALRDDGATIPWDPELNQPLDADGYVARLWRDAGSPIPQEYVAPVVTSWVIPKSVVISRLTDAQLDTVMSIMSNRQKERWRSPDSPSVRNDDEEVIAMLQAVGADPAVVLAQP